MSNSARHSSLEFSPRHGFSFMLKLSSARTMHSFFSEKTDITPPIASFDSTTPRPTKTFFRCILCNQLPLLKKHISCERLSSLCTTVCLPQLPEKDACKIKNMNQNAFCVLKVDADRVTKDWVDCPLGAGLELRTASEVVRHAANGFARLLALSIDYVKSIRHR